LAQDAHATELRSDVSDVVVQLEGIDVTVTVVLIKMSAYMLTEAAEVAQLHAEFVKLGSMLKSRPLVVPLKESATAKECRLPGYNARALLGAAARRSEGCWGARGQGQAQAQSRGQVGAVHV